MATFEENPTLSFKSTSFDNSSRADSEPIASKSVAFKFIPPNYRRRSEALWNSFTMIEEEPSWMAKVNKSLTIGFTVFSHLWQYLLSSSLEEH